MSTLHDNSFAEERDERGGDGDAGRGPVLADAAGREVNVHVNVLQEVGVVIGKLQLWLK